MKLKMGLVCAQNTHFNNLPQLFIWRASSYFIPLIFFSFNCTVVWLKEKKSLCAQDKICESKCFDMIFAFMNTE